MQNISTVRSIALGIAVVAIGLSGCKRPGSSVPVNQAVGVDGGASESRGPDDVNVSPVRLTVSPSSQSVQFHPDDAGFFDHDFCRTNVVTFTATLTNTSASPIYVSAYDPTNVSVDSLRLGSTDVGYVDRYHTWSQAPSAVAEQALTLLQPGAHVDFAIGAICPVADTYAERHFAYEGPGTYTTKITYRYPWRDAPIDYQTPDARSAPHFHAGSDPPTFHGAVSSDVLTINAK